MTMIRHAEPADAAALSALAAETFPLACPPGSAPGSIQAFIDEHLSTRQFERYLADPGRRILVAGDFDGYAMLVTGEPTGGDVAAALTARPTAALSKLYVRQAAHGAGIASALVDAVTEVAAELGAASVWLTVNEHNGRANAFYERSGFHVVGNTQFTVGDEVHDDFIRERRL